MKEGDERPCVAARVVVDFLSKPPRLLLAIRVKGGEAEEALVVVLRVGMANSARATEQASSREDACPGKSSIQRFASENAAQKAKSFTSIGTPSQRLPRRPSTRMLMP